MLHKIIRNGKLYIGFGDVNLSHDLNLSNFFRRITVHLKIQGLQSDWGRARDT